MVINHVPYLDIDFICSDGTHHIRIGRRQPLGPSRNTTTQRGPKLTPVRREEVDRKGYVRRSR